MRYGICLTSFDRVDCALINEEIVRATMPSCAAISHATASATLAPHLEDEFVRRPPLPLNEGAVDLLRASIEALEHWDLPYLVHLEADTWITDERVILAKIEDMERADALLSTTMWSPPGWRLGPRVWWGRFKNAGIGQVIGARDYSTQFFIMRRQPEMLDAVRSLDVARLSAECAFYREVRRRIPADRVAIMTERSPVVDSNRWESDALALHSQHWPAAGTSRDPRPVGDPGRIPDDAPGKREVLLRAGLGDIGPNARRLVEADDLDYYNAGAKRY